MKTAKKLGVKTAAVYSDADVHSMHTAMADEAFRIGEAASTSSYLRGEYIIDVAKSCGAQAIHPGYGFLSENAQFANACASADLEFIGPPSSAIVAMGSKSESKKIMEAAGVPCVPGYHGDAQDTETLLREAEQIGYPVMLKAVMGGGGKGMREVWSADEFVEKLESAKREAISSFGDDRFLVEKFVVKPRHVELQVFADKFGNCVHLFERDCSLQRRHQKVIEEAPAPHMTPELRAEMGAAAVAAAKAVGYVGAGTVEFILDASGAFYFMEMNTRLQVEHPVTEMITQQDLVEWQLHVAAGNPLPLAQDELHIHGHSFEARIYAENPRAGFLPATGTLHHLNPPSASNDVRIETGVRQGDQVSMYYDPMIAKLVVWDADRDKALRKLTARLAEYEVVGVPTNIDFLTKCASHPEFGAGHVDTGFIDKHIDDLLPSDNGVDTSRLALAATCVALSKMQAAGSLGGSSPWESLGAFRLNNLGTTSLTLGDGQKVVVATTPDGSFDVKIGEETIRTKGSLDADGSFNILSQDQRHRGTAVLGASSVNMFMASGDHFSVETPPSPYATAGTQAGGGGMVAPMPGKIVKIMVSPQDVVKKGTPIMAMEAMKMEHVIKAPADGTVEKFLYEVGEQVEEKKLLVEFSVEEA